MSGRASSCLALAAAAACVLPTAASCIGGRSVHDRRSDGEAARDAAAGAARSDKSRSTADMGHVDALPAPPDVAVHTPASDLLEGPAPEDATPQEDRRADDVNVFPHVRVSRRGAYVDVDATVCLAQGALELVATKAQGKTHEAVFAITAPPRHLHAAVLLLGLQSGSPGRWDRGFATPATGDRVGIWVVGAGDDEGAETPVNRLVVNRETGESLPDNVFVFAGRSSPARPRASARSTPPTSGAT